MFLFLLPQKKRRKKNSQLTGNIPTTFTKGYVNVKIKTFIDPSYNNINIRYEFSIRDVERNVLTLPGENLPYSNINYMFNIQIF